MIFFIGEIAEKFSIETIIDDFNLIKERRAQLQLIDYCIFYFVKVFFLWLPLHKILGSTLVQKALFFKYFLKIYLQIHLQGHTRKCAGISEENVPPSLGLTKMNAC